MRNLILGCLVLFSTAALATETRLVVRARARDGTFIGKTSAYEAEVPVQQKGAYEVTVTAFDPATGNAGVDHTAFVVE